MIIKTAARLLVWRGDRLLVGMRGRDARFGQGLWAVPGGEIEFGETMERCASRELLEETGMIAIDLRHVITREWIDLDDHQHWISIYMTCDTVGDPRVTEPTKTVGWRFCSYLELTAMPTFPTMTKNVRQFFQLCGKSITT